MNWNHFELDIRYEACLDALELKTYLVGILAYRAGIETNEVFVSNCRQFARSSMSELIFKKPSKFTVEHLEFLDQL